MQPSGGGSEREPLELQRNASRHGSAAARPDPAVREPGAFSTARRVAGARLEDAAHRVRRVSDRVACEKPRLERARPLGERAALRIESAADYVRSHEVPEMQDDLEAEIRRHPVRAVVVAFLMGYLVRRIF